MSVGPAIQLLEIAVVILFFTNKVLILIGKRFGWLLGAGAALSAILYFSYAGLLAYLVLQLGMVVVMIFGFLRAPKDRVFEVLTYSVVVGVLATLGVLMFDGLLTAPKFIVCLGMLGGTLLLAKSKFRLGWLILGVVNTLSFFLGYTKGRIFFADFQLASSIVAFLGMIFSSPES